MPYILYKDRFLKTSKLDKKMNREYKEQEDKEQIAKYNLNTNVELPIQTFLRSPDITAIREKYPAIFF